MADQKNRRSPRLHNTPSTTRRRITAPSPLALPASSATLPTPLSSSTTVEDPPQLLPSANIAPAPTPSSPIAPAPRSPKTNSPAASPLSPLTPSEPASPTWSDSSDDMPIAELAPGIMQYAPGKLPTVEDSAAAAQSLAEPRNCTRLAAKIRAYARANNLADGAFMDSAVNAFESPKMLADLRQAAARLELSLPSLTFADLESVLKAAFMRGSTDAFVDKFRALARLPSESPHDFLDRLEYMNYDVPENKRDSQEELIRRTIKSFGSAFKNFCFLNAQFKDLTDWKIPEADVGASSSTKRDAAIGSFKDTLDIAWNLHVSTVNDRTYDIDSAIDAALAKRGISSDSRKRGLSTASHVAHMPEPKRASSFSSNMAPSMPRPPPMPTFATVNAVGYPSAPRPRNDLRGHRNTLIRYSGCFDCFTLFANHSARDCTLRTGTPVAPRYALEDPAVVAIIESEIVATGRRNVTLDMLEHLIDSRSQSAGSAAATAPNNIPVASRVNAVPGGAYISPNSSYE
ncbi:hypothetical protein HDZ31DRAFT_20603, partial [Schizophyllum fasciatum]